MKNVIFGMATASSFLFFSCVSKTPFLHETRQQMESGQLNVEQLQFYTDREIVFTRELASDKVKINAGKIKHENGKYIHRVVIKKHTPGVCVSKDSSGLLMVFEKGKQRELQFRLSANEYYTLLPTIEQGQDLMVHYDGKVYKTDPQMLETKLLVKKKMARPYEMNQRKAKGVRVAGRFPF